MIVELFFITLLLELIVIILGLYLYTMFKITQIIKEIFNEESNCTK